ncbi:TPA: type IV conjugative transfer system coupling protein TraD [Photobacterium damselae]
MLAKHKARPKSSTQSFTRGGQIFFHNWRMYFQVITRIVHWSLWISAIATVILGYWMFDANDLLTLKYLIDAKLASFSGNHPVIVTYQGHDYTYAAKELLASPRFQEAVDSIINQFLWAFMGVFLFTLFVNYLLSQYLTSKGEEQTQDYLVRGTEIASPQELERRLKKDKNTSPFKLDGLSLLPNNFEVRHLSFSGSTGTGKSVTIRKLLREIRARGDKAIIYDKGCTFVSRFYDEHKDYILNPFDERSVDWKIWYDAQEFSDFESLAASLITDSGHGDPFWIESARTLFTNTAYKMSQDGQPQTTERLLDYVLKTPTSVLREFLKGTMASAITDEKADKIAISVKSILAAFIKSLRYLEGLDQQDKNGKRRKAFSVRDWVLDDKEKGFLFLTSNAQQHVALRPLISMWLSTASTAILGLEESATRRIWVITDELPSLHRLPDLPSTLDEVRKHGGCYLIGFQSFAQFVKIYGREAAEEMYDLLNTRFYFRNPSAPQAEKSSKDLGEQEIEVSKEQYSYGANSVRDGISLGHQTITRPAVMTSEIMELDDLQCWYRTFGGYPITRLKFKYDDMPSVAAPFIKRVYDSSDTMKRIDGELAHYQMGALLALPDEDKQVLLNIHKARHNNEQGDHDQSSYDNECEQMKETVKENNDRMDKKQTDKSRNDDQDIEKQKMKEEQELKRQLSPDDQTEQAFKEMEETAIDSGLNP